MKKVPTGLQDFKKLRDEGCYYMDKSLMIKEILDSGSEVILYTRPRRFGKSLNLSMLDAFFNINYKNNSWLTGLKISDYPEYNDRKNAYPVIYFDFKELSASNFENFNSDLVEKMSDLYRQFKYIIDSEVIDKVDKEYFDNVFSCKLDASKLRKSISRLSRILHEHHGKKVIILIDEYDNPIHNAYGKPFHSDIVQVMREILSSALKGNESLQFGVITGVMQIFKESIFSGLNNLYVNNIFSNDFNEYYGFTDDEVKKICSDYGHPEKYEEAKEWYDGYVFGKTEIYNPWSILSYVKSGFKPEAYWGGTSGNSIINDLLERTDSESAENILKLASGGSISMKILPTMTYDMLNINNEALYSLLTLTGYLKAVPDGEKYLLSVPNKEMYAVYEETIANRISVNIGPTKIVDFRKAMLSKNTAEMEKILETLFMDILDPKVLVGEKVYQAFIASFVNGLSGRYEVTTESHGGTGYSDILIKKKYGEGPHMIIELKKADSDTDYDGVKKLAEKAVNQIEEKKYFHGLKGDVLVFGIAFSGYTPAVVSREYNL